MASQGIFRAVAASASGLTGPQGRRALRSGEGILAEIEDYLFCHPSEYYYRLENFASLCKCITEKTRLNEI